MRAIGYAGLLCGWAWIAGVALGDLIALPYWSAIATLSTLLGVYAWARRPDSLAPLLPLAVAALLLGNARFVAATGARTDELREWIGQKVVLRGEVVDDAAVGLSLERATVEVDEVVTADGTVHPVRDRVVIYTPFLTELRIGQRLRLSGRLATPQANGDFDFRGYLADRGVHAAIYRPSVERVVHDPSSWTAALSRARRAVNAALAAALPEPAAAIAQGLVTGEQAALSPEAREAFAATNTTHLLAVSGANVSLVIAAVRPLLIRLGRRQLAFAGSLVAVVGYTALVGAEPSALRAAGMGVLALWARSLGRPSDGHTALAVAGVAMTLIDPLWIRELGFQLSFLATAGLIVFAPSIEWRLRSLPSLLRESLALTLAATIAVLPVLALSINRISLVGPLVNLAVAPLVAPATILALLLAPLALLSPVVAAPVAWVEWILLALLERIVVLGASVSAASVPVVGLGWGVATLYCLLLVVVALGGRSSPFAGLLPSTGDLWRYVANRTPIRWLLAVLLAAALVTWAGAIAGLAGAPVLTFLNVGQGDSILVEAPNGRVVLIDGGPSPSLAVQLLDRRLPFWRRRIDLLVLTHPHDDHLVGLVEVARRYDVGGTLESGIAGGTPAWEAFERVLLTKGTPRHVAAVGDGVDLGDGLRLTVIGAPDPRQARGAGEREANDLSLVLRLDAPTGAALLMADAGPSAQRRLLAEGAHLRAPLLKVPHHGAEDCLDGDFLGAVSPSVAVISVGAENGFGHPSSQTIDMLEASGVWALYRTDEHLSVEVELASDGLRFRTGR